MGLVNWCVPDVRFDAAIDHLTAEMFALSFHSHRDNKALLHESDGLSPDAGFAHELFRSVGVGPDAPSRLATFTAKRSG